MLAPSLSPVTATPSDPAPSELGRNARAAPSLGAWARRMSDATTNDYASDATNDDPFEVLDDPTLDKQTLTNDAVAGETVIDTGHYAGAEGSEPLEASPELADNDLSNEEIDLDAG